VADAAGLPLALHAAAAPPPAIPLVTPTLLAGFGAQALRRLVGDKACDSDPLDQYLAATGIELLAPQKRNRTKPPPQAGRVLPRYKRRWKIERLGAWRQSAVSPPVSTPIAKTSWASCILAVAKSCYVALSESNSTFTLPAQSFCRYGVRECRITDVVESPHAVDILCVVKQSVVQKRRCVCAGLSDLDGAVAVFAAALFDDEAAFVVGIIRPVQVDFIRPDVIHAEIGRCVRQGRRQIDRYAARVGIHASRIVVSRRHADVKAAGRIVLMRRAELRNARRQIERRIR
jgi:hypothetical protein